MPTLAMFPLFETKRQRRMFDQVGFNFLDQSSHSIGERGMMAYLKYMVKQARWLQRGDLLLFDGEKSFATPLVKAYLAKKGITTFVIEPSILHQFMNPADNDFHSVFKLKYYRLLSRGNYAKLSDYEKFYLAKTAYQAITSSSIVSMFEKCGLLATEKDKSDVVFNFMFEGIRALGKNGDFHKRNLAEYLDWCDRNGFEFLYSHLNGNILRMAGMIK